MLGRRCAVKLIHPKWSLHPHLLIRFEREVQVLARISHPHIVQIHDYGFTNDGVFYFVMGFLDGKNLEQTVNDEGPLSPGIAIEMLIPVADALNVIHEGGIVHRDVKPSNIFLAKTSHGESIQNRRRSRKTATRYRPNCKTCCSVAFQKIPIAGLKPPRNSPRPSGKSKFDRLWLR